MMSRAAETHLAGHMRPAGLVFETPGLVHIYKDYLVELPRCKQDKFGHPLRLAKN
jgi:hypothetical protein